MLSGSPIVPLDHEEHPMKVKELMTREVASCRPEASLAEAARLFWERDCGLVPVVDGEGLLLGVLTDRDACLAALFQGGTLASLPVARTMSREIVACQASDSLESALSVMADRQVRRLPVVDAGGRLEGLISLCDLLRSAVQAKDAKHGHQLLVQTAEALAAIVDPHRRTREKEAVAELRPAPRAAAPAKTKGKTTKSKSKAGR
jgi:CBS domain-containing protein